MRLPLLALLVLALAVAGCASSPPPDNTGGTGGSGSGGSGNNTTMPPPPPAPTGVEVVNETYSYSPAPPGEASFTVPAGHTTIAFTATFTSTAPLCVIPTVTLVVTNPDGESATFQAGQQVGQTCNVQVPGELPAAEGDWTVTFDGVGTAQVQLVGLAA